MIKKFNDFNNSINESIRDEFKKCCILVKLDGEVEKVYCFDTIDKANENAHEFVRYLEHLNDDKHIESNDFRGDGIRYYAEDIECLGSTNRINHYKSCEILSFRCDDFYDDLKLIIRDLKLNDKI